MRFPSIPSRANTENERNKGYFKLKDANEKFGVDFRGKAVLDIGSSTGGFTLFALDSGARKVIAVEKGTRQMREPMRSDARVELHEKTDIFDFKTKEKIDIIVADVSFISLIKIIRYARNYFFAAGTVGILMVKPQFEAEREQLTRGVVKNEKMRREILKKFESEIKNLGFLVLNKADNKVIGRKGNVERFYLVKKGR